jgi:CBS domain-containing protein
MATRHVGTLVVVNDEKQPIGILTDRDLALRVVGHGRDPFGTTIADVMTANPKAIPEETPIEDTLDHMRIHGVRRLPVVGQNGRLVGIVSLDDILTLLADELRQASKLLERSLPEKGIG